MTPKRKVITLAAQLGAEVEYGTPGHHFEITVDAPDGFHWKGDGLHQLVCEADDGHTTEAWRAAYGRMSSGLEECDYSDRECADVAGMNHPDLAD